MSVTGDLSGVSPQSTGAIDGVVGIGGALSAVSPQSTGAISGVLGVGGTLPGKSPQSVASMSGGSFRAPILLRQDVEPVWLVEATYRDADTGSEVTEYLSTHAVQFIGDDDAPAVQYESGIISPLQMQRSMFSGDSIGGVSLPSYGGVEWAWGDAFRDSGRLSKWRRAAWDRRTVRILLGERGAAYRDYVVLHEGPFAAAPRFSLGKATLALADASFLLDREIDASTYGGTGGFDGGADLEGKVKPEVLGIVYDAPPVPVDVANRWYDVSHSGLTEDPITSVKDGAVPLTLTTSNPPAGGQVYIDYAAGRIRIATAPRYGLTITCRGAFAGGATDAATILKHLCTDRLGIPLATLDAPSFTATAAAAPWTVGRYISEPVTGLQLANELVGSIDGYFTGKRGGLLTVGQVPRPSAASRADPAVVLVIDDSLLQGGDLTVEPVSAPPSRFEVGHARRWAGAASDSDVDGTNATAEAIEFAKAEYRVAADDVAGQTAKHPSSKPNMIDTLLIYKADADALVARRKAGYGAERARYTATIGGQPFALELGQQVWIESDVNGISAPAVAVDLDENGREFSVQITSWG